MQEKSWKSSAWHGTETFGKGRDRANRRLARRANRDLGKVENRKLGRAEDRLTEGWPEGRSIGGDASHRLPKAAPQEEQIGKSANQLSGSERVNMQSKSRGT